MDEPEDEFRTPPELRELKNDGPGLFDEGINPHADQFTRNDNFYAILNLPKNATQAEIRERYHELSILLHPDKAPPQHRETAETQFRRLNLAYETLYDPEKRAVYDALGEEGLKTDWRVGQKFKSPEEFREEFTKWTASEWDPLSQRILNPISNSGTCVVDVQRVFDPDLPTRDRLRSVQVRRTGLASVYKTVFGTATTCSIRASAAVASGGQSASHGLLGTVRHQFSPRFAFAATANLLQPHVLKFNASYNVDAYTHVEAEAIAPLALFAPKLQFSVSRRLYANALGTLTYSTGSALSKSPSFFGVSYVKIPSGPSRHGLGQALLSNDSHSYNVNLQMAEVGPILGTTYAIPVTSSLNLHTGFQLSLFGRGMFTRADIRLTKGLLFTWETRLTSDGGLVFDFGRLLGLREEHAEEIRARRKEAEEVVAMMKDHVARRVEAERKRDGEFAACILQLNGFAILPFRRVCFATLLPSVLFERGVEDDLGRRGPDRLGANVSLGNGKRSRAPQFQRLTVEVIWREREGRQKLESTQHLPQGWPLIARPPPRVLFPLWKANPFVCLIIERALYGNAELIDAGGSRRQEVVDGGEVVDVTSAVQALVHSSQLTIPAGRSKSGLVGFWDPCVGQAKRLLVRYTFKGRPHLAVVDDQAPLLLPLRGHVLE